MREAARLFEDAGVARTERSIVNWCQPGKVGISRLDAYYDTNERKYYITPQSVERVISEEQAKRREGAAGHGGNGAEDARFPDGSEDGRRRVEVTSQGDSDRIAELELKVRDLEITNRVKDEVISMKDQAIERMQDDQREYVERLIESSHRIGELETRASPQLRSPGSA